jgi:hypothetical protein
MSLVPRSFLRLLVPLVALTTACGPRVRTTQDPVAAEPAPQQEEAQAPPAPAPASSERFDRQVAGWTILTLRHAGYRCSEDSPTFQCMTNDDTWVINVTIRPQGEQMLILFDSMVPRAQGTQCASYRTQMDGLRSAANLFTVDCNDSSGQFRMNTALTYAQDLDLVGWMQAYRQHRFDAWHRLGGS